MKKDYSNFTFMPARIFHHFFLLSFLLTTMLSCMKDKPEELPSQLEWNPQLALPVGQHIFGMNEESGFPEDLYDIDSTTGLPFWVNKQVLRMWGTIQFDLDVVHNNMDHIANLLLRINMENGFPHELVVQGYYVDGNRQPLDSLFTDRRPVRLPPATIGAQGQVLRTTIVTVDVAYSKEEFLDLGPVAELVLQGRIFDPAPEVDTTLVDFYPEFSVVTDLGVMLDMRNSFLTWD